MRRSLASMFAACVASSMCWSCGGAALVRYTPASPDTVRPHDAGCTVQVFHDALPGRRYVELGVIDYHHERHRASADDLRLDVALPAIEKRACAVGADALVNIRVTEQRRLEWAMFHVSATAVRFAH